MDSSPAIAQSAVDLSPAHLCSFPAHGSSVVTCLLIADETIIAASDDHSILVHSISGEVVHNLQGHEGGIWSLVRHENTLVSGSTDRTVRVWDLEVGECTHIFGGHTSTVRAMSLVKPDSRAVPWEADDSTDDGILWPQRPLVLTGSRDHTARLWTLPQPNEPSFIMADDLEDSTETEAMENDLKKNPYHICVLEGHNDAVRDAEGCGRVGVTASYDCTVRVWNLAVKKVQWVFHGHSQKVYSVKLDMDRGQVYSGGMDGTVRIWSLKTGTCLHVLTGHESLVGLLSLSPSFLVSAAADATTRVWNPDTGELQHVFTDAAGAITCCAHDDAKLLTGSDGCLFLYDLSAGKFAGRMLTGITGVWQVAYNDRWCVAASNRHNTTCLDVWDFRNVA